MILGDDLEAKLAKLGAASNLFDVISRREFLQLYGAGMASALGFPHMTELDPEREEPHRAVALPNGFGGVAIPLKSDLHLHRFPNDEEGYIEYVVRKLEDPDWWWVWEGRLYREDKNAYCTIRPPNQYEHPDKIASYVLDHLPGAIDPNMRTWMLLCEPSNPTYGGLSVVDAMEFTNNTMTEFGRRLRSGLWSYQFIAPNDNINGPNGEWVREYWRKARHSSKKLRLGVHAWGRWGYHRPDGEWKPGLEVHWNTLIRWMRSIGEDSVWVTEAGRGSNTSDEEEIEWWQIAEERMLHTPELKGISATAAVHTWDRQRWQGLLGQDGELTPLGRHWMELRNRINLG